MHDIAYHIDNLLVELPNHVKLQDKEKIEKLLNVLNSEKSKKRCCDKRRMLLILAKELHLKIDGNVDKISSSSSEIQRILYLDDDHISLLYRVCSFAPSGKGLNMEPNLYETRDFWANHVTHDH